MKTACAIFALLLLTAHLSAHAQNFTNLNFEAAKVAGQSPGTFIPATNGMPHWTAYFGSSFGTNTSAVVAYDAISLGGPTAAINDTNTGGGFVPLQGKFSAALNGIIPSNPPPNDLFTAIGQTGQVPVGSESLTFFADSVSGLQVTFAGNLIPLFQLGTGSGFLIVGGDISAYAGNTGELLFTALPGRGANLDNILFSPTPIPEPTALALMAVGGLLFRCRRPRKSS